MRTGMWLWSRAKTVGASSWQRENITIIFLHAKGFTFCHEDTSWFSSKSAPGRGGGDACYSSVRMYSPYVLLLSRWTRTPLGTASVWCPLFSSCLPFLFSSFFFLIGRKTWRALLVTRCVCQAHPQPNLSMTRICTSFVAVLCCRGNSLMVCSKAFGLDSIIRMHSAARFPVFFRPDSMKAGSQVTVWTRWIPQTTGTSYRFVDAFS